MTAKWQNYSFRNTAGGASGTISGLPADDATQNTDVMLPAVVYPTTGKDGKFFGKSSGSTPAAVDVSSTNAGSPGLNYELTAGYHTLTNNDAAVQFDKDPGTYDLRCAFGPQSTATPTGYFIDGTYAQFKSDVTLPGAGFTIWSSGMTVTAGQVIASADLGVWLATTGGTASTVEPNGGTTGSTFSDGTAVWTRASRNILARIQGTSSGGGSKVVDANNTALNANGWSAATTTKTITITNGHSGAGGPSALTLCRGTANTYPRQVSLRVQAFTLFDVTINNEWGEVVGGGGSPNLYANQPAGLNLYKILTTTGAANAAAFSLSGALASYFTPVDFGGSVWLQTSGTRIPDSLAGSRTLTLTQTDTNATVTTHATTLTFTVVTSNGRLADGSQLGQMSTEQYLLRQKVLDAHNAVDGTGLWTGYNNQSFVGDYYVESGGELSQFLKGNIPASQGGGTWTPNGTGWYRVRLRNGTYGGGSAYSGHVLNMGTGGLLVEPEASQDPAIASSYVGCIINGLHVRNIRNICDRDIINSGFGGQSWYFIDPGTSLGFTSKFLFENVRFGLGFYPEQGYSPAQIADKARGCVLSYNGTSAWFKNCQFNGTGAACQIIATRIARWTGNDYQNSTNDVRKIGANNAYNTSRAYVADNHQYVYIANETSLGSVDTSNANHFDYIQVVTFQGNASFWFANTGPNGNSSPPWNYSSTTPTYMVNNVDFKIYKTASGTTTGITGSTRPATNATGIVDGGVVWDYVCDYDASMRGDTNVACEHNLIDSVSSATNSADIEFCINSNTQHGSKHYWSFYNNLILTGSSYGVQPGEGECWIFRDTHSVATLMYNGKSANFQYVSSSTGARIRDDANIWAAAYSPGAALYSSQRGTITLPPSAAITVLRATFSLSATTPAYYHPPAGSIVVDGSATQADFVSQHSKAFHHTTGAIGARLSEIWPVTVTDTGTSQTVTQNLTVTP